MPWVKGQSGNPKGRPKKFADWRESDDAQRLRDLAYEVLEAACCEDNDVEWKDRIAAAKELLDRTEGRPSQALTGAEGAPLRLGVVVLPTEDGDQ